MTRFLHVIFFLLSLFTFSTLHAQSPKDLVERTILHLGNNDLEALKATCFIKPEEVVTYLKLSEEQSDPKNLELYMKMRIEKFEKAYRTIQAFAAEKGIDWKKIKLRKITGEKEIDQMEVGTKQDIEFTFKYGGTYYSMELDDCIKTALRGWIITDRLNDLEVVE